MSSLLITIVSTLFAWTIIMLILSWLLALSYPLLKRPLTSINAPNAALCTLLYGLTPLFSAVIVLLLLSQPELIQPLIVDHCHNEICEPHTLHFSMSTLMGLGSVTLAVVLLVLICLLVSRQLLNKHRHFRVLNQLSETKPESYHVVESSNLFAWCVGLWRPEVYISKGLLNSLNNKQLNIVLAHEFSHVRRRDNLRRWLLHWATITWPRQYRQQICQDLKNYSEQACDLEAVLQENAHDDLESVVTLIGEHCLSNSLKHESAKTRQRRLAGLKYELNARHQPQAYGSKFITRFLVFSGLWTVLLVSSVYVGHPLLEWLSQ